MCLTALSWQPNDAVPLRVVANRDEFRDRPTETMHWWPQENILAGKDLKAGGTWLGFNKNGRFALLTNIRPGYVGVDRPLSRGELVTDYLKNDGSIEDYHRMIRRKIDDYSGFNLILGNQNGCFWFSSIQPQGRWLSPGVHALSNASLNTPWPKTMLAIEQMKSHLRTKEPHLENHDILSSQATSNPKTLPDTGVPLEWEIKLSAQTIVGEEYGTRSRTHFTQTRDGQFDVVEQQIDSEGAIVTRQTFSF